MNQDLLYALLAMDVYHRGPVGGLTAVVPQTQIDDTTRSDASVSEAIGFFAQSYLHEGQRIIVYRGTDDGGANFWDIAGGLIGLGGTLDAEWLQHRIRRVHRIHKLRQQSPFISRSSKVLLPSIPG